MRKAQITPLIVIYAFILGVIPSPAQNNAEQTCIKRTEYVVVEDTIKLATDIYLPAEQGQFPCILVRTPYYKENLEKEAESFVQRGYAVVCQDTRGKFASDGVFYAFRYERHDGLATVNWIKSQPWYNGKIGGWGGSYVGYTQWAVSDQLDAMTPLLTTANMYDGLYPDGLFSLATAFRWGLQVAAKTSNKIPSQKIEASCSILPLSVADDSTYKPNKITDDWLLNSHQNVFWGSMNHRALAACPVFSVAGWYDIFLMAQIEDFEALGANRHPDSHLMIGPWAHGKASAKLDYGEQGDFGKCGMAMLRRFMDRHLKSDTVAVIQAPFMNEPYLLFIMHRNEWYGCKRWPPKNCEFTDYYLGPNANLSPSRFNQDEHVEYVYDPADPYPSLGGTLLGGGVGPAWQNDNLSRSDQAVFESEVLDTPLVLLGPISATLYVSTDAPSTDFVVCLQDIYPDSQILNIQEGAATIYSDASAEPRVQQIEISVWATGYQLQESHRLRVSISSSWFPRYNRNLNTGEPIFSAQTIRVANQRLFFGSRYPSCVTLPVLSID